MNQQLFVQSRGQRYVKKGQFSFLFVLCFLLFITCSSPMQDGSGAGSGTITINLGSGITARAGWNNAVGIPGLDLSYELWLIDGNTPPGREEIPVNTAAGTATKSSVSPGNYSIEVFAKVNGWDYAKKTTAPFSVAAGEIKDVRITMDRLPDAIVLSVKKDELLEFPAFGVGGSLSESITIYDFTGNSSGAIGVSVGGSVFSLTTPSVNITTGPDASGSFSITTAPISIADVYYDTLTFNGPGSFIASIPISLAVYDTVIGAGTSSSPYEIWNTSALSFVGKGAANPLAYQDWTLDKYYKLMSNLTLTGNWNYPIGTLTDPFTGSFDGNDLIISNLSMTAYNRLRGLFGQISGTVENLGLVGVVINAASGDIDYYSGGVVGINDGGIVRNCFVTGAITNYGVAGGVVGCCENGALVENCYNTANITTTGVNNSSAGGIVGYLLSGSTLKNSYNTGTVSGYGRVGGAVGHSENTSTVTCCYSTGNVTNNNTNALGRAGGIAGGTPSGGTIQTINSFANNVALGLSVTNASGGTSGRFGGAIQGLNNSARDDMTVNGSPVTGTAADTNGADLAVTNTVALSSVFSGGDWGNTAIWAMPILGGNLVTGCQLPTLATMLPPASLPTLP